MHSFQTRSSGKEKWNTQHVHWRAHNNIKRACAVDTQCTHKWVKNSTKWQNEMIRNKSMGNCRWRCNNSLAQRHSNLDKRFNSIKQKQQAFYVPLDKLAINKWYVPQMCLAILSQINWIYLLVRIVPRFTLGYFIVPQILYGYFMCLFCSQKLVKIILCLF